MNFRILVLALITAALAHAPSPQPGNNTPLIGVRQGQLGGQPGITVTLGTHCEVLAGTVAFNLASKETGMPHLIGSDAHAHILLLPQVVGITLKFQVIRKSDARQLHISMRLTAEGRARLQSAD